MQFQQDWPKDEKITALLIFLPENLEKFHSTELYGAALEGSTIFLCCSSFGCTSMESCQSADLKYGSFLNSTYMLEAWKNLLTFKNYLLLRNFFYTIVITYWLTNLFNVH